MLNKKEHRGVTIVELMMAMAMTVIVVSIIFAVWGNYHRHIIEQRRKSILQSEIKQVLGGLTSQIRRSPAVLAWHSTGITYVSPNNGDTIVYEYYTDELFKNDTPVHVTSQKAYISGFAVGKSEELSEDSELTLLSITLSMADDFANQVTVSSNIAAKVISEQEEEEDDLSKWNY